MLFSFSNLDLPFLFRWAGMICLALAYILVTAKILRSSDRLYPALGMLGSASVIIGSIELGAIQPIVFNGLWLIISVMSLLSLPIPGIFRRERVMNAAVAITFIASLSVFLSSNAPVISLINAFGFAAITLFLGSYTLFLAGYMNTLKFHLYNFFANTWMSGILIYSENWALVAMTAMMLSATVIGIYREFRMFRRLGLA